MINCGVDGLVRATVKPVCKHAHSPRLASSSKVEKLLGALAESLAVVLLNSALHRGDERLGLDATA